MNIAPNTVATSTLDNHTQNVRLVSVIVICDIMQSSMMQFQDQCFYRDHTSTFSSPIASENFTIFDTLWSSVLR